MAIQKNFVVKNGLEVNSNLIFADTNSNKVGIATTIVNYNLHVNGGIGVTNLTVTGISTINNLVLNNLTLNGYVNVGGSTGKEGQVLVTTGTGVTWSTISKTSQVFSASVGQTIFSFSYEIGSVEVYINGVRLSPNEFVATDGSTVVLNDACFGDETVELLGNIFTPGISDRWTETFDGNVYRLSNVGVGTTNPTSKLHVVGNGLFTGIITASSFVGNGSGLTNIASASYATTSGIATYATSSGIATYANVSGIATYATSSGIATYATTSGISTYATSSGISTNVIGGISSVTQLSVTGISTFTNGPVLIGSGSSTGTATQRLQVTGDAYVSGNVGLGTTNPTSKLTIQGNVIVSGIVTASSFVGDGSGLINISSGLQTRTTVSGITTSISNNGIGNTNISGFKSYALMRVGLSTAGWLRIYTDNTSRANDASRSIGVDPSAGSGVIAEVITTGISTTQIITPFVMGGNLDTPETNTIYAAITNLSGITTTISVNLTILKLEE